MMKYFSVESAGFCSANSMQLSYTLHFIHGQMNKHILFIDVWIPVGIE